MGNCLFSSKNRTTGTHGEDEGDSLKELQEFKGASHKLIQISDTSRKNTSRFFYI
jgi:hypothetical protein